jgi:hypothetical protein
VFVQIGVSAHERGEDYERVRSHTGPVASVLTYAPCRLRSRL